MSKFIDTFKRKECKYRLSSEQRKEITETIYKHMHHDEHGLCKVDSLYFDTVDNSIICRSLEKPLFKEKLRLRSYSNVDSDLSLDVWPISEPVFVELKKKYKGVVYKRRIKMSYLAAMQFLSGAPYCKSICEYPLKNEVEQLDCKSAHNRQIAHEIEAFANKGYSPLQPAMLISCKREAFTQNLEEAQNDDVLRELRITFDSNIKYKKCNGFFDIDKKLSESSDWNDLLLGGESIMEIKALGAYPMWLTQALQQSEIYPTSFSKYGESFSAIYKQTHDVSLGKNTAEVKQDIIQKAQQGTFQDSNQDANQDTVSSPKHLKKEKGAHLVGIPQVS